MAYTLFNVVSTKPINCNVGYNNSWLQVENDANRDLFAQASYVTNFDDFAVTLSAKDVNIGAVEIKDWNSENKVDVVADDGFNALRVLSQDLEASVDDITIGDKQGNFATIQASQSALRVYPVTNAGGFTRCASQTTGNPSFVPSQIIIYNPTNSKVFVELTLTSGDNCRIPMDKHDEVNHFVVLNLAVSAVNNYAGCEITFFA